MPTEESHRESLLDLIERQASVLHHARTALEDAERALVRGMVRAQETGATAEEIAARAGMDVPRVKDLIAEGPEMAPIKEPSRDADG